MKLLMKIPKTAWALPLAIFMVSTSVHAEGNGEANPSSSSTSGTTSGSTQDMSGQSTSGSTTSGTSGSSGQMGAAKSARGAMMKPQMGQNYQVIEFKRGTATLTDNAKKNLRSLVDNAKAKGTIDKLHVAVWSDKAVPAANRPDLSDADRKLADDRISAIESYVSETLQVSNIDTHNMAEKTDWFARGFNTQEAELSSLFAQEGAPSDVTPEQFKVVKQKGGPMKAVILLNMEGQSTRTPASESGTTSPSDDSGY